MHVDVYEAVVESFDGETLVLRGDGPCVFKLPDQFEYLIQPTLPIKPGVVVEVRQYRDHPGSEVKRTVIDTLEVDQISHEEVIQTLLDAGVDP